VVSSTRPTPSPSAVAQALRQFVESGPFGLAQRADAPFRDQIEQRVEFGVFERIQIARASAGHIDPGLGASPRPLDDLTPAPTAWTTPGATGGASRRIGPTELGDERQFGAQSPLPGAHHGDTEDEGEQQERRPLTV